VPESAMKGARSLGARHQDQEDGEGARSAMTWCRIGHVWWQFLGYVVPAPRVSGASSSGMWCQRLGYAVPAPRVCGASSSGMWCQRLGYVVPTPRVCGASSSSMRCQLLEYVVPAPRVCGASSSGMWCQLLEYVVPAPRVCGASSSSMRCQPPRAVLPSPRAWLPDPRGRGARPTAPSCQTHEPSCQIVETPGPTSRGVMPKHEKDGARRCGWLWPDDDWTPPPRSSLSTLELGLRHGKIAVDRRHVVGARERGPRSDAHALARGIRKNVNGRCPTPRRRPSGDPGTPPEEFDVPPSARPPSARPQSKGPLAELPEPLHDVRTSKQRQLRS
jgi:hypothetical protein